jgi:hypothetical protein
MNDNRFRYLWKAMCATYKKNNHCFKHGCGKETMGHWVRESAHVLLNERELKKVINTAIAMGWAKELERSPSNYRRYKLHC